MKQNLLVLIFIVFTAAANSQAIKPQVLSTTGASTKFDGGSFSYTVGEMTMVQTFISSDESVVFTQGFEQPDLFSSATSTTEPGNSGINSIKLYPNPAVDNIGYGFQFAEDGKVSVSIYNSVGQKIADVYQGDYINGTVSQTAHVAEFAAGIYFLHVSFTSGRSGDSQIIAKKFIVVN